MSKKLKPCPFCGKPVEREDFHIQCMNIYNCWQPQLWGLEAKDAIAFWNSRPIEDALINAAERLINYRDRNGALNFQLEKADDYINLLRAAVSKAKGEQP